MTLPRVLLVEDDPSIRRFVGMAIEDLPIHLDSCSSVAEARQVLGRGRVALVLLDVMLPGESGLGLLASSDAKALVGEALVALFSAGLTPGARSTLAQLPIPIWRELPKPVSLGVLRACVTDALDHSPEPMRSSAAQPGAAAAALTAAIAEHFEGDTRLFSLFHGMCLAQFPADIGTGDRAVACGDLTELRRLAHSLKSVFFTLGQTEDGRLAKVLETIASDGNADEAGSAWAALRRRLVRQIKPTSSE